MSENDLECFASSGVNTPGTMFAYSGQHLSAVSIIDLKTGGDRSDPRCWYTGSFEIRSSNAQMPR
jgi:hypothetical protein